MTHPTAPYPETADIETSSDEYAGRFAGPTGEWMLKVQETLTLELLEKVPAKTILDVGGGHGQLAYPCCARGYDVTVLGSAECCRKRIAPLVDSGQCRFVVGNVIELPFPDRSFDAVIAFRMLTHCVQWPRLVAELCRVAKHAVVADYPTNQSLNVIAPLFFKAKLKMEGNTRAWELFRHREMLAEFARNGYRLQASRAQFFFPMVLHRMLKNRYLSTLAEGLSRGLGLTRLWGSPVISLMTPQSRDAQEDRERLP
ncbi:MAG: class I SAM-dependent methyltransferase [Lentisphaerae bacterium]|nr:class I SAM-dependent methyltransferase [Lentisphaerota bacterium]